ncbi:tRNA pseudouridine(55) synthase [Lentibacillus sp. JNUCC-1]|uniref:tRNA pseudouridine(55) synthase TruB n=1 Tax=Lentibacillus sp. JNUCC-1 TaxID=2654513 RepID=UPI0012E8CD8F|nr:tRNA pseudouridine(55) synthase TruB [Lentibacillus sp. JNUCC-1]MUV39917.1 tRNA pseudouridine(55) synthase [Lentibacillus sp. JNUCC-1]
MDGILPLWKPPGMTSHDCVMKVRRLLQTKKVGHTGTLDPDAEGVLPLCIGRATKLVPYMTNTAKEYIATVQLGTATETEDASGAVVEEATITHMPSNLEIEQALNAFKGTIVQIPPMYSAVRVKGKHLYEYARAQEQVERPERHVIINQISLLPSTGQAQHKFDIKVVCSKGTYIRTLCVDIGKKLGYPAHMAKLYRTKTGSVTKKDTYTFDHIQAAVKNAQPDTLLLPMTAGIEGMERLTVDEKTKQKVLQGQKLPLPDQRLNDPFAIIADGELLAIYQYHPNNNDEIKPVRVFN